MSIGRRVALALPVHMWVNPEIPLVGHECTVNQMSVVLEVRSGSSWQMTISNLRSSCTTAVVQDFHVWS
ncbi:MAG: hypothetical protein KDB03_02305 [Planctomycetales bacterium]|nr:hypothetical protein [Planctomycetales bacterium]